MIMLDILEIETNWGEVRAFKLSGAFSLDMRIHIMFQTFNLSFSVVYN